MSPGQAPNPVLRNRTTDCGMVGGQVPLEMLASELESHLAHLNNELVELINRWGPPWDQHCTRPTRKRPPLTRLRPVATLRVYPSRCSPHGDGGVALGQLCVWGGTPD
jgi:hypothetical protein